MTYGKDEYQQLREDISPSEAGRNPHWQISRIDWCDRDGTRVLSEGRAVGAEPLSQGDGYLLVTDVVLTSPGKALSIRRDAFSGGVQFFVRSGLRLTGPVTYLRDKSALAIGLTWHQCFWAAAIVPAEAGTFTVLRIEGKSNPDAEWVTRDNGCFGSSWDLSLAPGQSKSVRVLWVLASGARDADWCNAIASHLRGSAGALSPELPSNTHKAP
ncbi:MAG: PmoA family protein [Planctomycetes bacterium]|nr:PmoA family protein [Planctomycetota bacterium]